MRQIFKVSIRNNENLHIVHVSAMFLEKQILKCFHKVYNFAEKN